MSSGCSVPEYRARSVSICTGALHVSGQRRLLASSTRTSDTDLGPVQPRLFALLYEKIGMVWTGLLYQGVPAKGTHAEHTLDHSFHCGGQTVAS